MTTNMKKINMKMSSKEEVLSKKTSLQNEKAGLAKPPPQDHFGMERPTSQKKGKRPASRSQLDSKQSATSSVV